MPVGTRCQKTGWRYTLDFDWYVGSWPMVLDNALHNVDYAKYLDIKKWRNHWPHQLGLYSGRYRKGLEANY